MEGRFELAVAKETIEKSISSINKLYGNIS